MIDLSKSTDIQGVILKSSHATINAYWLGKQSYEPIWQLQKDLHARKVKGQIADIFLLLEHDHVYTFGKNADRDHLLPTYPEEADVVQIDRGGDITYHGPGQLVGYPIIDLHNYKKSITWYMRALEGVIITTLAELGISAHRNGDMTGVWVEDEKICAMGVRLSRWVTMHGFALNLAPDMRFFDGMIPCGIFEYGVTSIQDKISDKISIYDLADHVRGHFIETFLAEHMAGENA